MPKLLFLEEFHLTIRVPADRPEKELADMRKVLDSGYFRSRLQSAARRLARRHPELALAHLKIAR